ncbi:MAG TPA: 50S ribosomal protein L25 [Longimicrobium sp.]|nr:50S ribosomal protein L25 [Longimicrobium sp.]
MAANVSLAASTRGDGGKGVARKLRGTGRIPAVLYGHGEGSRALSVDGHELEKLMGRISVENTIVRLDIEGEGPQDVLIREVQMHPYKPEVLHVDFFHLHAGETIHLRIPVRLAGTPVGVREDGGVLDHVMYDLEVECLPGNIPDAIEVDVSGLEIGQSARIGDLSVDNVKILHDPDLPIASVVAPTRAPVEGEEPEAAPAEPELVRTRKSDEEE